MMNLLLAGNDKVYPGMELVVYSTLTHNKGINWYIFTMDITLYAPDNTPIEFKGLGEWEKNKLRRIVNYLDNTSKITFVDTHDLYMEHFLGNPNEFSWLTPYAPLRLLADIALPHIDHVLYLDCDTAVDGDLTSMYHDYLKLGHEYYAYVCPDACNYDGEMVSGVMLMDLAKCRQTDFLERARENVRRNEYKYYDQDALRDAGSAYPLPETYSYLWEYDKLSYKPIIYHFTNKLLPKIYDNTIGRNRFFRTYPFLNYVKEGIELLDSINWKDCDKSEYTNK